MNPTINLKEIRKNLIKGFRQQILDLWEEIKLLTDRSEIESLEGLMAAKRYELNQYLLMDL